MLGSWLRRSHCSPAPRTRYRVEEVRANGDQHTDEVQGHIGQERSESFALEHKEKFSPSLIKSVAAMANTYGGLIVVGVTDQK
jgi:Putative DNA-binding domain